MSNIAIEVSNVWKKFKRGELHDSLRDLIPAIAKRVMGRGPKRNELGQGDFWALKDVSFGVQRGEVLGIIGSNGAGKSTILKLLSRILRPNKGQIEVNGRLGALIEVGAGFHPDLTGRENIYLNGTILGMRKDEIEKRFDEIVEFSGLEEFIDTPVKRYSSGMYTRLGFSVAAHVEPDILLVDEVLSVGDIGFQKKCLSKMQDVAGYGRTVVFVSHNMGAVKSLCDRCLLLRDGTVQAEGPPAAIVDLYIAQFEEVSPGDRSTRIEADRDFFGISGEGFLLHHGDQVRQVALVCGQALAVEFVVETPKPLSEASVGITITKVTGEPVVSMSSKVQGIPSVNGFSRFWKVHCDMGHLPLNADTYSVDVYLGNGIHDVARFSKAVTLRVLEHDVFGWGNKLPSVRWWGPVYWAPKWNIRPTDWKSPTTPLSVSDETSQ